jgi:hypothetical protein
MKIVLNSVITSPFELEIKAEDKISTLQSLAGEFCKISFGVVIPNNSKIIHKGFVLDSSKSIKDCDIQNLDTLLLLFKIEEKIQQIPEAKEKKQKVKEPHPEEENKEEGQQIEEERKEHEENWENIITNEENNEVEDSNENNEKDSGEYSYENSDEDSDEDLEKEEQLESSESEGDINSENRFFEISEFGPEQLVRIANIAAQIDWSDFPLPNPEDLETLEAMGFPKWRCQKALLLNNFNPELALDWLLNNTDNPDVDDPLTADQLSQMISIVPEEDIRGKKSLTKEIKEAVENNRCTFTVTGKRFVKQKWFFCYTCGFVDSEGICEGCANVCHKGHTLSEPKGMEHGSTFFCDCGSGETCQCNK